MSFNILQIPATERPRERMEKFGIQALSDSELLALMIRSGGPALNALELAQSLLTEFGDLANVIDADEEVLKKIKYMGVSKVSCIKALGELAKRCYALKPHEKKTKDKLSKGCF